MKKQFLVLLAVLFLLVSCRYEENLDVATTENSHKSLTDATFHELSKTTKLLDVSSLMAKSSDFVDDYLATDYLIDTTQIKKTIKNGEITEFAVFLSKKNEMQTGVFYNLVLTKRKNEWKKYLLKLTPCLLLGSDSKVGYKCEFISKKAQTLKCGSTFYMVEYFSCPAGHTDPSDGDCNGCWNLTSYGATNTCDEEAPDDFLATGGTYGGGTTPNIDGLINAYADSSHLNLYYQLSTENRFKCYQALILSGDTAMVNFSIDFFYNNPTTTIQQFQNWFIETPLSDTALLSELIEDTTDPNRVKPTTRFKNNVKINSIYNQIKTAANFKQYLQNFEPTFSVAHLMFDVGTVTKPDAIAQTREPINYWIKITFNQNWDYINTPKIVIANTFMHEIIHAEILRKLLSISSTPQGNIDWNQVMNFVNTHNYPGLFDYYTRYTVSDNDTDHEIMGAHYVNILVNFLKQVYGTQYTNVEYKTVAWMGLKGTKAWSLLPQSERELYLDTWQNNYWLWEM